VLARAAARQHERRLIPRLVERLVDRDGRDAVRAALVTFGTEAEDAVWWAMRDASRPRSFRIHCPTTLACFGDRASAERLLESIETEEDGLVRYKSIRALMVLVERHGVTVDRLRVEQLAQAALVRHFRLLSLRAALGTPDRDERAGAERLLRGLLEDKLRQSLERAFMLLAAAHPGEDFRQVRNACMSADAFTRANGGEFLDTLLGHRDQRLLRELLRLVTDDLPAAERAARAAHLLAGSTPGSRDEALGTLARDGDVTLASLARRSVGTEPKPRADGSGRTQVAHA